MTANDHLINKTFNFYIKYSPSRVTNIVFHLSVPVTHYEENRRPDFPKGFWSDIDTPRRVCKNEAGGGTYPETSRTTSVTEWITNVFNSFLALL